MNSPLAKAPARGIDPENLQASMLALILRVYAILGTVVYVPSMYGALRDGLHAVAVIDTVAIATVFGLSFAKSLPFRLRALLLCLINYAVGVGLLVGVGSISQIYLFGFSFITVILFGIRAGLASVLLNALTLLVVGGLGHAAPEMALPRWDFSLSQWVVITLNFALVNSLLTFAIGAIIAAVTGALAREVTARGSLDRERTLLRTVIDTLPDLVFTKDRAGRFVTCNAATLRLTGLEREDQIAGKTVFDLWAPEIAAPYHADDLEVMAGKALRNREERSVDAQGNPIWYLTAKVPLLDANGEATGLLGISRDVTDRVAAEAMRAHMAAIVESSEDAIVSVTPEGLITSWNAGAEKLYQYSAAEMAGRSIFQLSLPGAVDDERPVLERVARGEAVAPFEAKRSRKDGSVVEVGVTVSPVRDARENVIGVSNISRDLTRQRQTEAALKRSEEQFRQAQKMEAVGRLAGGVAHDFNNLLSVILGCGNMAIDDLKPGDPLRSDLAEIIKAGERAAELTRQLLAFSRQQVLQPRVIDLGVVVGGMERMLKRLLREDIELALIVAPGLGRVLADPGQIEQVVMNLAVNARDAMPEGGKLTLETTNVELDEAYVSAHYSAAAGQYVMLAVSDTGIGMDAATRARIFEPFFTTKPVGEGTGIGLATVFGIVQQSGGHIGVYSEPGRGSTFKVYLPRTHRIDDAARAANPATLARGTETILLVEDEEQVRRVACAILRRQGYHVLEASNGGEALLIAEEVKAEIHLLVTDVVMPRVSGRKLYERLAPERPAMGVLYTSGYTDDAIVRHGVLEAGVAFLQKPFKPDALLRKVREVLEARAAGR